MLAQPALQFDDERPAALVAHREALFGREAVDLALDGEQGIDALDCLDRDRRFLQPRQVEELASPMRPAGRLDDRSALARGLVEPVEPGIGIRLHQADIAGQVTLGMLAAAVGRVEERRRRRIGSAERLVVAHIGPQPSRAGLALGLDRHRGVVGRIRSAAKT